MIGFRNRSEVFKLKLMSVGLIILLVYYWTKAKENEKPVKYIRTQDWNLNYKPNGSRFIIYVCSGSCPELSCRNEYRLLCGGWGDRLKGISAGFIWALLTNRTFLIKLTEPCLLQNSLDSNNILWHENLNSTLDRVNRKELNFVQVSIHASRGVFENSKLLNESVRSLNFLEYQNATDVVFLRTNVNLDRLLVDPMYKERVDQLGMPQDQRKVFHSFYFIYNMLFKFANRLQVKYDGFLNKNKLKQNMTLICAQVRLGGKTSYMNDPIRVRDDHVDIIWNFIKTNFSSTIETGNFKLYVTSDQAKVYDSARKQFPSDKIIVSDGELRHIDQSHEYIKLTNKTDECEDYDKTFLDFALLGLCDMGVISSSSFGLHGVYNRPAFNPNIYIFVQESNLTYEFRRLK
jgi:hypothetical protein